MARRSSRFVLRISLALLLCVGAASRSWAENRCAGGTPPDESGIGGTGLRPGGAESDDSGVGGTGVQPDDPDDDSGVGGTGISFEGDTGVIGTISGFASICVGSLEVHYEASSAVSVDGQAAVAAELAIGQVVEIVARGVGSELDAQSITVRHVVTGPVTAVATERGELEVVGQSVRLSAATRAGDGASEWTAVATDFPIGTAVRVSGMRQADGVIAASRVTSSPDQVARIEGAVGLDDAGRVTVAGTPLRVADDAVLAPGEEVRVVGSWDGTRLVASAVERVAPVPFDGRVGRLDVAGYPRLTNAELHIGPYRFDLSRAALDALPELTANAPVRIEAVVRDRQAVIERIEAAPQAPPGIERGGPAPHGARGLGSPHAAGADDRHDQPPRDGRSAMPPADSDAHGGAAMRPEGVERPPRPDAGDHPPHIDRPPAPSRPDLPSRPDRPPRPGQP